MPQVGNWRRCRHQRSSPSSFTLGPPPRPISGPSLISGFLFSPTRMMTTGTLVGCHGPVGESSRSHQRSRHQRRSPSEPDTGDWCACDVKSSFHDGRPNLDRSKTAEHATGCGWTLGTFTDTERIPWDGQGPHLLPPPSRPSRPLTSEAAWAMRLLQRVRSAHRTPPVPLGGSLAGA